MFHLGWFMGSGFSVQTWTLDPWAGSTGHDWMKGDLFVDLAASLERAGFDYLLVEDTSMVDDAYGALHGNHAQVRDAGAEVRSGSTDPAADGAH